MSALWEDKPDVPDYLRVDLPSVQQEIADANLSILPKSTKLGAGMNEYSRAERGKTLSGIPGLNDLESLTAGNLSDWLSGNWGGTEDVLRRANAKAYAGGFGGGGGYGMGTFAGNLGARDLGLTDLQVKQSAIPLASQYLSGAYSRRAIPEYDPSFMMLNPQFAANLQSNENSQIWNRNWLANRIAAQPEPWQQELMAANSEFGSMALGSGGGGGMGGGGGHGWYG